MKRAAAALLLLLLARPARADGSFRPAANLDGTPEELLGFRAAERGRFVDARELGEKVLAANPRSFAGEFLLGVAFHHGDGDLPRAVFHLERAVSLYVERYGPWPQPDRPWRWHEEALVALADAYADLDMPEKKLAVLDALGRSFTPRDGLRIWPLIKLHRYDEVRLLSHRLLLVGSEDDRDEARTALCVLATEKEADSGLAACGADAAAWRHRKYGMHAFSNVANAASNQLRFDLAERDYLEATRRGSLAYAWCALAELYLRLGRYAEALQALKHVLAWRVNAPPEALNSEAAGIARLESRVMLVAGEFDRAVEAAERAAVQPDRNGHVSDDARLTAATAAELASEARLQRARRLEEQAAVQPFWAALRLRSRALADRLQAWRHHRRRVRAVSDPEVFRAWLIDEIPVGVEGLGRGVAQAAMEQMRKQARQPGRGPYFAAALALAQHRDGDDGALESAERALAELPAAEVQLRAELSAIGANAAERRHLPERAAPLWSYALERDAGVLRQHGLRLPVRLVAAGDAVAARAAALLARSPRFAVSDGARFTLRLEARRACLFGDAGAQLLCTALPAPGRDVDESARVAADEVQHKLLLARVDLTQADLQSLDGSPTAARVDGQLREILGEAAPMTPEQLKRMKKEIEAEEARQRR